jgi:hypothetical protein
MLGYGRLGNKQLFRRFGKIQSARNGVKYF